MGVLSIAQGLKNKRETFNPQSPNSNTLTHFSTFFYREKKTAKNFGVRNILPLPNFFSRDTALLIAWADANFSREREDNEEIQRDG